MQPWLRLAQASGAIQCAFALPNGWGRSNAEGPEEGALLSCRVASARLWAAARHADAHPRLFYHPSRAFLDE